MAHRAYCQWLEERSTELWVGIEDKMFILFNYNKIDKLNKINKKQNENKGFANQNLRERANALFRGKLMPLIMSLI